MFPFYDGWLTVERSAMHSMDRYVTESMLPFPSGWVEMRQLKWSQPVESVCTSSSRCYMVNLSISGWNTGGSARYLRPHRRRDFDRIGQMWLLPPGQTLHFSSTGGETRSIRCAFDASLLESFLADTPRWCEDGDLLHAAFNLSGGQIEWLMRRMYRELRSPDFATPQIIETLAKQLAVEIIRTLKLHREEDTRYVGGLPPWRLRLIRKRLWSDEPLPDLEELATLCDMTVRHLSRAFRSETGRTIGKHIESAMVDRARRMLENHVPVRDVAVALGYATSGSFAAAFRRATGLLPSEVNATERVRADSRPRPTATV